MSFLYRTFTLFSFLFFCLGCDNRPKTADDDETHYHEDERAEHADWDKAAIEVFIQNAAMVDKTQIILGDLVKEKAEHEAVAGYAELIRRDHTFSLRNLRTRATKMGISIPESLDSAHQAKIENIMRVEVDFDREFLEMMVQTHKKDIQYYENAMQSITQEHPIKDWIDTNIPKLQQHLFSAQRLLDDEALFPVTALGNMKIPQ